MSEVNSYAMIQGGIVAGITPWDGNADTETGGWTPPDETIMVQLVNDQQAYVGYPATQQGDGSWVFSGPPIPPVYVPTQADIVATNTAMRSHLLDKAGAALAPLQDALDLDDIEPAEQTLLTKWKQYRVAVNRVDLTVVSPAWPEPPAPLNYVEAPTPPANA
jgi:hypothetical protein